MRTIVRTHCWVLILIGAGCGGSELSLVPVSGRVLYHGEPLSSGTIVFTPDLQRGARGPMAWGEVHDGTFRLSTGGQTGVVPGWHRITIASLPGNATGTQTAGPRLPTRYRDPQLSELLREVKSGQENIVNFDLE